MKHIERKLWIFIAFWFAFFVILYTCSSCSVQENVCTPHFGDGKIVRVTDKEVITVNYLGYEIPHYIHKNDTTNYIVGELLILNR